MAPSIRNVISSILPRSTTPTLPAFDSPSPPYSTRTTDSSSPSPSSLVSFTISSCKSLSFRRRILLLTTFVTGTLLTATMKWESVLWLLASTAGTTPILGWEQGSEFDYPGLRFGLDGKFEITVFSDLHLGDGDRPGTDGRTVGVVKDVLDREKSTDLVVLNGDLVSCEWVDQSTANGLVDQIVGPLVERKMPFAATFGNHDMSRTCSTRVMQERMWNMTNGEGKRRLTFTQNSVGGVYEDVGTSNYYIPVYASSGGGNPELKMMLWFFDSKGGQKFDPDRQGASEPVADWVDNKVISWFKLTRNQINKDNGRVIPSLAFVHIPPSVTEAFRKSDQRTETTEPGLNEEIISVQANSIPGGDSSFLQALVETEGLIATFSGHDHRIDWCMKYSTTRPIPSYNPPTSARETHFCFNRHTGYGGYSDYERGGRQIVVEEEKVGLNVVETYIRLEGGRISGRVMLNSTYGTDQYPAVEKIKSFAAVGGEGGGEAESTSALTSSATAVAAAESETEA